eukprot:471879-Amphidinium_carterae.1
MGWRLRMRLLQARMAQNRDTRHGRRERRVSHEKRTPTSADSVVTHQPDSHVQKLRFTQRALNSLRSYNLAYGYPRATRTSLVQDSGIG